MNILGLSFLTLYNVFMIWYFKRFFTQKLNSKIAYFCIVVVNIFIVKSACNLFDERFIIYFMMISMMITSHLIFNVNGLQMLFAGVFYAFSIYSSAGIVFSLYAIFTSTTIQMVLLEHCNLVFMFAVTMSIVLSLIFNKIITPHAMDRQLANNKEQLKFVVIYMFIEIIFLTLINDGRFRDVNQYWLSYLYLISAVISKIGLLFVINHTAKVAILLEYELYTQQLKKQLYKQIMHYNSYKQFIDDYREFKHDYKKLINSIKLLIKNKEYDKALKLIDGIEETANNDIFAHKLYSNNVLLDAILQDAANICLIKNIEFSAYINLPENVAITKVNIIKIFANVIDNAIEACEKLENQKGFINVKSMIVDEWLIVEFENSFEGKLKEKYGRFKSSKENRLFHGLGLRIVMETIDEIGGVVSIEPNYNSNIFKIRLCIPKA